MICGSFSTVAWVIWDFTLKGTFKIFQYLAYILREYLGIMSRTNNSKYRLMAVQNALWYILGSYMIVYRFFVRRIAAC